MAWNDWTAEEQAEWDRIDETRGALQDALYGQVDGLMLHFMARGLPADEVLGTVILHLSGRLAGVAGVPLAQEFTRRVYREISDCERDGFPHDREWHRLAVLSPAGTA